MTQASADGAVLHAPAVDRTSVPSNASQADAAAPRLAADDRRGSIRDASAIAASTAAMDVRTMPAARASDASAATAARRPGIVAIARRFLVLAFGIAQALLILRIGMLAFAAGGGNSLTAALLQGGLALEAPFRGIFHTNEIALSGGALIDITAFVALLGWTLLQGALIALLSLASPSRRW